MQFCLFAQTVDLLDDFGGRTWARTKDPLIKSYYLGLFWGVQSRSNLFKCDLRYVI